jgi:hypothetical protein
MSIRVISYVAIIMLLSACTKIGSDAWCEQKKEQPKGEWTVQETTQFTKYCVLGFSPDKRCKKLEKKPKSDWSASEALEYAQNCVFDLDDD